MSRSDSRRIMAGPFSVIAGNRDVVESLEHALDMAKRGKLVGVVICGLSEVDGESASGFHWAHRGDLEYPWARLTAAVSDAMVALAAKGLDE